MKKNIILLSLLPIFLFSQNGFYLGCGGISSFGKTFSNNSEFQSKNTTGFGLYYGNHLVINHYFKITSEISYLNNELILAQNENKRFELHQNIGFGIKPSFYFGKHTFSLVTGISGIYIFDKDEEFGNVIDRFDESYFYGLEYGYNITEKTIINLGFLYSSFDAMSHYTTHVLESFSVVKLAIYYHLY